MRPAVLPAGKGLERQKPLTGLLCGRKSTFDNLGGVRMWAEPVKRAGLLRCERLRLDGVQP